MKKFIKMVFIVGILLLVIGIVGFLGYCFAVTSNVELDENVMNQQSIKLKIYDKNGHQIELCGYRDNLTFDEIPQNLIDAFVCIEDRKFFEHSGIDVERIAKALVKNVISGSNKEGASTITQQFIKNTHLTIDKSLDRKVKEIKLALELEKMYSKEEILTAYFNILYFGNSIYGVQTASQAFFGKECKDLTLSECATFAGIVKNPAKYSPMKNLENSTERRNLVLLKMKENGYISESEYNVAKSEKIVLQNKQNQIGLSYLNCLLEECADVLNITEKELAYSDYSIYTEYDADLQSYVETILKNEKNLANTISGEKSDAYALVTNNDSGLISAYYNSLSVNVKEFKRQPGSTIKPFVSYLPSLSQGKIYPASPVLDEKKSFGNYSPSNFGNKYLGWTTVRQAVSKSINSVAVELMNSFGIENSIEYAKKFGLTFDEKDYGLSTALGGMTYGSSPIEITSAYMTLARKGNYKESTFVKEIVDCNSKTVYKNDMAGKQVEDEVNAYLMTNMLEDCAKSGTSSRLCTKNYNVASKTGTAGLKNENNNDIWNLSYTSKNTLCIWMGNGQNKSDNALTKDSLASVYPTEVASKIFNRLYSESTPQDFEIPSNVTTMAYSKEYFEKEHVLMSPNDYCSSNEVYYDIFKKDVLLPTCEIDIDVNESIEFDIILKNGGVNIEFYAKDGITYSVQKTSLFDEWSEVFLLKGKDNLETLIDKEITYGNDYVYKIEAYVTNYKNETKNLGESQEKYLALPFALW